MSQLNEKLVRNKAKELLKEGTAKQSTYEQLTEEFGYPTAVAKILKQMPSRKAWKKYGIWNHVLSAVMLFLFIVSAISSPTIGTFLWYGLPTLAIVLRKTRYYFWVAILAGLGTIGTIAITLVSSDNLEVAGFVGLALFLVLIIPAAIIAIWLPKKLTPEPEEEREYYENEHGQQRSRIIFKFVD